MLADFMQRKCLFPALIALCLASLPQTVAQTNANQTSAANDHNAALMKDLSGTWAIRTPPGVGWYNYALIPGEPPMTPWAEERFKGNKPSFGPNQQQDSNDPAYRCFPASAPRMYAGVQAAMQIIQLPDRVLMLDGRNLRVIYTDGRQHPNLSKPLWMGHSIGDWDGNTFVIDTVDISDRNWLDRMGHPHSNKLHLIERFQRVDSNTLLLDITIDDPIAYTRIWQATQRTFRLRPNARAGESICEDTFVNPAFGLKPILPSMN